MAKKKSSKYAPKNCETMTIRCLKPNKKGERSCGIVCNSGKRLGAVINEKKGTIRFYK